MVLLDRHWLFAPQLSVVAAVVSSHIQSTPVSSNWFVSSPTLFVLRATYYVVVHALLYIHLFPLQFVAVQLHQGNPRQSLSLREASLIPHYTSTFPLALLRQHLHRLEPPRYLQNQALRQPLKTSLQPFAHHHQLSLQTKTFSNRNITYSNKSGKNSILNCILLVISIRKSPATHSSIQH